VNNLFPIQLETRKVDKPIPFTGELQAILPDAATAIAFPPTPVGCGAIDDMCSGNDVQVVALAPSFHAENPETVNGMSPTAIAVAPDGSAAYVLAGPPPTCLDDQTCRNERFLVALNPETEALGVTVSLPGAVAFAIDPR
jgi:DNA-binding beta-propeller fold protein YncE